MVRLQYDNNKQYKVTLPKAIIDAKGWQKGDELKIAFDAEGNLVLKKLPEAIGMQKVQTKNKARGSYS
jgi:bifunctional DNA-binding transcriptional regulator/antitoxin component of YhaV-PrlF toxin-antitoxin module